MRREKEQREAEVLELQDEKGTLTKEIEAVQRQSIEV